MVRVIAAVLVVAAMVGWPGNGSARQDDPRLDELFARLRTTADAFEADRIESEIWDIWTASGDETLDALMLRGIRAMGQGDYDIALVAFNTIIEAAPDFAEGWNKRATLYWLMGDYEASVADIDKTLALEPRHFGALSGLAMIRMAQDRLEDAAEALKAVIAIHPHAGDAVRQLERIERIIGTET
jgi:tetratricopeptide (TPR) repeat protein